MSRGVNFTSMEWLVLEFHVRLFLQSSDLREFSTLRNRTAILDMYANESVQIWGNVIDINKKCRETLFSSVILPGSDVWLFH